MAQVNAVAPPPDGAIVVGGKTLISRERAASLLGVKPNSLSTALSRGEVKLSRIYRGRAPSFLLDEVEKLVLSRMFAPGERVRG